MIEAADRSIEPVLDLLELCIKDAVSVADRAAVFVLGIMKWYVGLTEGGIVLLRVGFTVLVDVAASDEEVEGERLMLGRVADIR